MDYGTITDYKVYFPESNIEAKIESVKVEDGNMILDVYYRGMSPMQSVIFNYGKLVDDTLYVKRTKIKRLG